MADVINVKTPSATSQILVLKSKQVLVQYKNVKNETQDDLAAFLLWSINHDQKMSRLC